ncbi:hypothetical protein [Pseudooceanicola sp.]|uniref:hypothetical protein n=1 Tax=Pseudooceanicola sp. TaxID=1914328 RepID=UPI0040586348
MRGNSDRSRADFGSGCFSSETEGSLRGAVVRNRTAACQVVQAIRSDGTPGEHKMKAAAITIHSSFFLSLLLFAAVLA